MSFHEKDVFCTVEGLFYKLSSIVLPTIQGKIDVFLLVWWILYLAKLCIGSPMGISPWFMCRRYFTSALTSYPTIRSQSLMSFVKMIYSRAMHGIRRTIDGIFFFPLRLFRLGRLRIKYRKFPSYLTFNFSVSSRISWEVSNRAYWSVITVPWHFTIISNKCLRNGSKTPRKCILWTIRGK